MLLITMKNLLLEARRQLRKLLMQQAVTLTTILKGNLEVMPNHSHKQGIGGAIGLQAA